MAIKLGTAGNDTLTGTAGADTLYGLEGNDILNGGTGDDILLGREGDDVLQGGGGADSLNGGTGNDTFKYTVFKDADKDRIVDFAAGDRIDFSAVAGRAFIGNTQFNGVAGEIRYYGGSASTYIQIDADGDATADYTVTVSGLFNFTQTAAGSGILIAAANQTLTGTANADTLNGSAGNDTLWGWDGNDKLYGGEGNDELYGGNGDDLLDGGLGADIHTGGAGVDVFRFTSPDQINGDILADFAGDRIAFAIAGLRYIGDVPFTGAGGEYCYEDGGQIAFDLDGDKLTDKTVFIKGFAGMLRETAAGSNVLMAALNQTLSGTANADTLTGGSGHDTLKGLAGNDILIGGMGRDALTGDSGDDILNGGTGDDSLYGGDGADTLIGGLGNDTLTGGTGNDTFKFDSLAEIGSGGSFDQIIDWTLGDRIDLSAIAGLTFAGMGSDFTGAINQVSTSTGHLKIDIDGDRSADYTIALPRPVNQRIEETVPGSRIFQIAVDQTLTGTAGDDTLTGGNGNDTLSGLAGNDMLSGGYGNDRLDGGDGADTLTGGLGQDTLTGGTGNDTFKFAALTEIDTSYGYSDMIVDLAVGDKIDLSAIAGLTFAGVGHGFTGMANQVRARGDSYGTSYLEVDTDGNKSADYALELKGYPIIEEVVPGSRIFQVPANRTLTGTAGDDTLTGGNGNDTLSGLAGNDMLSGGYGDDQLNGGDGADTLIGGLRNDTLSGGTGNDMLKGGDGNDWLSGGDGDDWLDGSYGRDTLYGGNGADTLSGGLGGDKLSGGVGNDTFTYSALAEISGDTIIDFSFGDKIDLAGVDANANLAGDQAFTFVGTNAFTGVAGQLRYQPGSYLYGDVDGNASHDFTIQLTGNPTLAAADFIL
jgi:Ca2+-binding RTX toxin-like protein